MRPARPASGGRQLTVAALFLTVTFLVIVAKTWNSESLARWWSPLHPIVTTVTELLSLPDPDPCDADDPDLPSVDDPEFKPPRASIFFHETSCHRDGGNRRLSPRQACSVESAALQNPDWGVYVLFSSYLNHAGDDLAEPLLEYPNVRFARLRLKTYGRGTPLEKWLKAGQLEQSAFRTSHTSDVLRFLTLWKYGGVYMDLDVVVAKSLNSLGLNWVGLEFSNVTGSSVLGFSRDRRGRRFTDAALRHISTNFRGDVWGHNGPHLVSRVLWDLCADHELPASVAEPRCQGIRMFPASYFYPFKSLEWYLYFEQSGIEQIKELENTTYVYHLWNKLSCDTNTNSTVQVPYTYLAEKFCPKVYNLSKEDFYALHH